MKKERTQEQENALRRRKVRKSKLKNRVDFTEVASSKKRRKQRRKLR